MLFSGMPSMADTPVNGVIMASLGAQNALRKQQLENQYYGPSQQADIAQKNALAGFQQSEAAKNQWQLQHPYSMLPDTLALLSYMQGGKLGAPQQTANNGNAINNNSSVNNAASGNTPSNNAIANSDFMLPDTNSINYTGDPGINSKIQSVLDPKGYALGLHAGQSDIDIYNKEADAAADAGNAQSTIKSALNLMAINRPKLPWYEKSVAARVNPWAVTTAAQNYDQGAGQLSIGNLSKVQASGHITDRDVALADKIGAGRERNQDAFNNYHDYMMALSDRIGERGAFIAAAKKAQVPSIYMRPLWTKYSLERPVYDFNKEVPIPGNANSFPLYLKNNGKDAINAMIAGKPYAPNLNVSNKNSTQQQSNPSANNVAPPVNNVAPTNNKQGVKNLSTGLKLPTFKSLADYQTWFKAQPKMVRDAVRMHLGVT